MFLILTKDSKRYTVESFKHQGDGIIFEYNDEMVYLDNKNIKVIDGSYKSANAKAYRKNV